MLARLKEIYHGLNEKLTLDYALYRRPTVGIESAFVFTEDFSVEEWETVIKSLSDNPERLETVVEMIKNASSKTPEERQQVIERAAYPGFTFIIGKKIRSKIQKEQSNRQEVANFYSLSDTNLKNARQAVKNLFEQE